MLKIEKIELPKEYERVILEEYYNFFSNLYGSSKTFHLSTPRFTTDPSKIRKIDLKDSCFVEALKAYQSIKKDNIEFILYGEDDVITALARLVVLPKESIHIAEAIFLNYPTTSEKLKYMKKLLVATQEYGECLECQKAYFEIPKFSPEFINLGLVSGYHFIEEETTQKNRSITYLMEKDLSFKRIQDEPTLSRKQTNQSN